MNAVPNSSAAARFEWSTLPIADGSLTVHALDKEHETEVLAFLAVEPLRTVVMAGFIRDNGLVSPLNRGTFYACRNSDGQLEGVALIGHATLIEARTEAATRSFAQLAQGCTSAHVIMGEQDQIEGFWSYYREAEQDLRLLCRELLFEQRWPVAVRETVSQLRLGTLEDLDLVAPVQAQMAFDECGVNPLEKDPEGFRRRCARRIEQGRVWVWIEDGRLLFKADVISETPDVNYIEGVYIAPEERRKGYGLRCMSQVGRELLRRTGSLSVLVNERNAEAQAFFRKAGYKLRGYYDTIYL